MPTPKQDKNKQLSFGELIQQAADQRAQNIETGAEADAQAILDLAEKQKANDASAIEQQEKIGQTHKDAVETANNSYFDTLKKAYEARMAEYEMDTKNDDEQYRKDTNRAQWIGLTEVVANIANAIGVANGASNQTIKTVSKDWMQKADQEHKERKQRLEQARENLSAREDAMNKVKLEGLLQAAGIDRENAQAILGLETAAAKNYTAAEGKAAERRSRGRDDAATVRYEGEIKGATADKQEAEQRRAESRQKAQWAAKLRMEGYNEDGSINEEYMADAKRAAELRSSSSSSGGGIPKDAFPLTSGNKTYWMDKDSIIATLNANSDLIPAEVMESITMLQADKTLTPEQRAYQLLPYMKKYPKLEEAMARSAYYVSEYNEEAKVSGNTEIPNVPASGGEKKDEKDKGQGGSRLSRLNK